MGERSIVVNSMRALTQHELEVVEASLELMAESKDHRFRDGARIMLEQHMQCNFFWVSKNIAQ